MTTTLKAIDTRYNGLRFRSRLEARWAVFMDAAGVPYEYEREGYDLGGIFYLPDFWLPQMQAHLEIKPGETSEEEWEKARRLAVHSGLPVYVLCGQPALPDFNGSKWGELQATAIYPLGQDFNHLWCECPVCHRCEIQFDGRADRIRCGCPKSAHGDKGYNYDSPRLLAAYNQARSARFEEGR